MTKKVEDLQAAENELTYWKTTKTACEAALRRIESDLAISKKQILVWERRKEKLVGGKKDEHRE